MSAVVWHMLRDVPMWGGTLHTTVCGRGRTLYDGANRTDDIDEVTCKLCLRRLASAEERRKRAGESNP